MEYFVLLLETIIFLILFIFFYKKYSALKLKYEKLKEGYRPSLFEISTLVRDYIEKNIKSVTVPKSIMGHLKDAIAKGIVEKFAPFTWEFQEKHKLNPKDAVYLGEPVDYIVFDGWRGEESIKRIVFVEVKSGEETKPKKTQAQIKNLIMNKKLKTDWVSLDLAVGEKMAKEDSIRMILEKKDFDARIKNTIDDSKIAELVDNFICEKERDRKK
ncbi:MAG: hypothetical protein DRP54_06550 [Spirochaetes bacterium]|nr:MAG: hypothetical protein DRP54_06550 [Spirochaetota bacterium]